MRGIRGPVALSGRRHTVAPRGDARNWAMPARPKYLPASSRRVSPGRITVAVLVIGLVAGCAASRPQPPAVAPSPPPAPAVRTPSAPVDTVMLVGRIQVTPALEKPARVSSTEEDYRNQAQLLFGERPSVLDAPDAPATVAVVVGEYFFVPYKRTRTLYYSGGVVGRSPFRINGYGGAEFPFAQPELRLVGTFRVDIKPGDRALYLGTFRYVRNAQGVTKVRRLDDYRQAKAQFEQKHPARGSLRRAVLKRVD